MSKSNKLKKVARQLRSLNLKKESSYILSLIKSSSLDGSNDIGEDLGGEEEDKVDISDFLTRDLPSDLKLKFLWAVKRNFGRKEVWREDILEKILGLIHYYIDLIVTNNSDINVLMKKKHDRYGRTDDDLPEILQRRENIIDNLKITISVFKELGGEFNRSIEDLVEEQDRERRLDGDPSLS